MTRRRVLWLTLTLVWASLTGFAQAGDSPNPLEQSPALQWSELPRLPDQVGLAGPFVGVSNGELLVAGGANFPDGPPWDGHAKIWHDAVYALANPGSDWRRVGSLPQPLAYGVSVSWRGGVVCLGGNNEESCVADAFVLRISPEGIDRQLLPSLPSPCAMACGALVGETVYVAGGISENEATQAGSNFWALDLSAAEPRWEELESWPGPPRLLAVAGSLNGSFYLFSGADLVAGENGTVTRRFLKDAYSYTPGKGWKRLADLPRPVAAAPSPAIAVGAGHLLIPGGDDGSLFEQNAELRNRHPGFPGDVLAYHSMTDTWATKGNLRDDLPQAEIDGGPTDEVSLPPVTTGVVEWNGGFVVPSGEVRPGVRSNRVWMATLSPRPSGLTTIDVGVLVAYFLAVVAVGLYFSRQNQVTENYFLGGRRIPWWAAGLSIYGSQLSAITFLTLPSKAFATDWVHLVGNFMILAMAPIVVHFYLPFYRRLGVTSIYEYLEVRFNLLVRLVGASSYLLLQLARLGIVLYLPALALSAVTGLNLYGCILAMGLLTTLYTTLGGVEAVVWTDVMQVLVLLFGALAGLAVMASGTPGGWGAIFSDGLEAGKYQFVHPGWSAAEPVLWVMILGRFLEQFIPYTADQGVAQRYLTTPTEKAAARSIWANALLTVPTTFLFFFIGTALWAFYRAHPARLDPSGKLDEIFPWFIAHELPVGVSGLLIAAVFAAAQSTLSTSINSMSAVITTDFFSRLVPSSREEARIRVARISTLLLGLAGTAFALMMARSASSSMWDANLRIVGLLGGGLAGIFAVGIFTQRPGAAATLIGFAIGVGCLAMAELSGQVSYLLFAGIGMSSCFLSATLLGFLFPRRDGSASNDVASR